MSVPYIPVAGSHVLVCHILGKPMSAPSVVARAAHGLKVRASGQCRGCRGNAKGCRGYTIPWADAWTERKKVTTDEPRLSIPKAQTYEDAIWLGSGMNPSEWLRYLEVFFGG